jgi:hypothetical protein
MSGEPPSKNAEDTEEKVPLGLISTSAKIGGGNNDSLFAKHIYELVKTGSIKELPESVFNVLVKNIVDPMD